SSFIATRERRRSPTEGTPGSSNSSGVRSGRSSIAEAPLLGGRVEGRRTDGAALPGRAEGASLGVCGGTLPDARGASLGGRGGALLDGRGASLGARGATLLGARGATLLGRGGATLLGARGAMLLGARGATLLGRGGDGRVLGAFTSGDWSESAATSSSGMTSSEGAENSPRAIRSERPDAKFVS